MREAEERSGELGAPGPLLMENAGRAIAEEIERLADGVEGVNVLVLVGPGNNGGDGLVAAYHLASAGAEVTAYLWRRKTDPDPHLETAASLGVAIVRAEGDPGLSGLQELVGAADIIVDALLGTGQKLPVQGLLKDVLGKVRRGVEEVSRARVVAVDLPTGVSSDTGEADVSALRANLTVTLGYPKVGHFTFPGAGLVGTLVVVDIGMRGELPETGLELTTPAEVRLPSRPLDSHKGTFGKVLVIGGSVNYTGAPCLSAMGAGRSGAGLVTLAVPQGIYAILASKLNETTFLPLPDDASPGALGPEALGPALEALRSYSSFAIGPGIGLRDSTVQFVKEFLLKATSGGAKRPGVVDADALTILSGMPDWWKRVPKGLVLTPHPGEMARLVGSSVEDVTAHRLETVRNAARVWGRVVVLKGAYTLVAAPDGRVNVNPANNPAMATAGTGDVLTGVIAGLMAQGLEPFAAAVAGVYLHGRAGEMLRADLGDAGMLAGDLLPMVPQAIRATKSAQGG